MASIMQSMKVQNKPSRNSFDMSENCAFTACMGAYQPVRHMHLNAGDKIRETLRFFSRTLPVRSAAYGRIRETFDFFFVPYRLIWRGYEGFFTDGKQRLNENNDSSFLADVSSVPFFTCTEAGLILKDTFASSLPFIAAEGGAGSGLDPDAPGLSFYGATRARDMHRLLEYLGYGKLINFSYDAHLSDTSTLVSRENIPLNALPLLAYHKIYYDFYRNTEWENNQPHMWFFDNTTQEMDLHLTSPTHNYVNSPHVFDLHYCNYEKDKFLGVLPNSQLGQPSVVDTFSSPGPISRSWLLGVDTDGKIKSASSGSVASPVLNSVSTLNENFNFSVLALRQSNAMQKWKEISQFAPMDYKHQIQAHYGFTIDEGRSNLVQYIDGCSSLVEINSVVNQNLQETEARIEGKGDNVGQCDINFTAPEPGVFMCIYHANPLVDYDGSYTMVPEVTKHFATDFPVPEFDSIGLQAVYQRELNFRTGRTQDTPSALLGYAPRYIDFKTRVDRTLGDFTASRRTWVLPLPERVTVGKALVPDARTHSSAQQNAVVVDQAYCRWKVDPDAAFNIFYLSPLLYHNRYEADPLMIDASFQTTKVSNLNYSGMPY